MVLDDTLLIAGLGVSLAVAATLPFLRHVRRKEESTQEAELEALRYGLHEPASLHPVVDPDRCIGIGSCASVCPEGDVLGLSRGQARPVSPARCVGHGLCERACPMEAIQLVFGTEKRGVELPRIREDFQTNVPGLYVIGELGGMGLIRNAFEQGAQCIDGIAREIRREGGSKGVLDVAIVGCGPAGLSAALHCLDRGIRYVALEKEDVGGAVRHYPRKKLVMTYPVKVPGYGKISAREIVKEDLIALWEDVIERTGLEVQTHQTVTAVMKEESDAFTVLTEGGSHRAGRVVLAIGRRGVPRKLGIPGEDSPKVAYALREPEAYQGDQILVVGGGDSAVEAALSLSEQPGNRVRISYRREAFSRIKPMNHERIQDAIGRSSLEVLWTTRPAEIQPDRVVLRGEREGAFALPNDHVFVFIGGQLPSGFLRACGVEIDTKFGEP